MSYHITVQYTAAALGFEEMRTPYTSGRTFIILHTATFLCVLLYTEFWCIKATPEYSMVNASYLLHRRDDTFGTQGH